VHRSSREGLANTKTTGKVGNRASQAVFPNGTTLAIHAMEETSVLIVGAGPTGLALAVTLGRTGIKVPSHHECPFVG
jgi:ribulose 1,5-bisphosphate synthetase/thiazole synthase